MAPKWEVRGRLGDEHRLNLGVLEVVVHRHIDSPGKWFVSCDRIRVVRHELPADDVMAARGEAILWCREVLGEYVDAVGTAP